MFWNGYILVFCSFLGIVGDWKNHFSPELEAKFNAFISEELKGTSITFPWNEEHKCYS